MPAVISDFEEKTGAKSWGNLRGVVIKILAAPQNPQPSAFLLPDRVKIKEHRQNLRLRVGVYAAVSRARLASNGDHRGSAVEV